MRHELDREFDDVRALGAAASLLIAARMDVPDPDDTIADRLLEAHGLHERHADLNGIRSLITNASVPGQSVSQPQLSVPQRRRLFLRNLVQVVACKTMTYPFVRELDPQAGSPAVTGVAEGALKGDGSQVIDFEPLLIQPGTLPVNLTVTDNLWDDAPAFKAYVNGRLPYEVMLREEYACFHGNGEPANAGITGLLNDPTVLSSSPDAGGLIATICELCATLAENEVEPDAVFVNAADLMRAVKKMTSDGGYPPEVLGLLPTVLGTVSVDPGVVIAGDFANGAAIVDREDVSIQELSQHSDYRARNLTLVQAEERVGFGVTAGWRFRYATGVTP